MKQFNSSHLPFLRLFKISAICILLIRILPIHAQVASIVVDSITMIPNRVIPFDEPFVLLIPIKSQRVSALYQIELLNRTSLRETVIRQKGMGFQQLSSRSYEIVKLNKTRYLKVDYGALYLARREAGAANNFYLDPGTSYAFLWAGDISNEAWEIFDQYRRYRTQSDVSESAQSLQKVKRLYRKLLISNRKQLGFPFIFTPSDTLNYSTPPPGGNNKLDNIHFKTSLSDWYDDPNTGLQSIYADLEQQEGALRDTLKKTYFSRSPTPDRQDAYRKFIGYLVQNNNTFDSELKTSFLPIPAKATNRLLRLEAIDDSTHQHLFTGLETLDCDACKPLSKRQYETRYTNIKSSLQQVSELYTIAASLAVNTPALGTAAKDLLFYKQRLQRIAPKLEALVAKRSALADSIAKISMQGLATFSSNTNVVGFETRNKLSIAPDFGVVTTYISSSGKANPYPFMPYLGFHVNLHPINRENYFRSYPHKLSHYLSLMVGWTLVEVNNGPKQAHRVDQDSITSYFGGKGTLLTGAGFRLGNAARITAGAQWYFKYNLNPTTNTYSERKLKAWPFIGFSLDLSLTTLLNGVADVVKSIPRSYVAPRVTTE
jgi:hypothetical protein